MCVMKKLLIIFILCSVPFFGLGIGLGDVIEATIQVESGGNPKAKAGKHLGVLQISPITVKECNRLQKEKRYTLQDRLSPEKSIEMWWIIQNHYNPEGDIEKAIRLWNGGPRYTKKGTERYYKKVLKTLNLRKH